MVGRVAFRVRMVDSPGRRDELARVAVAPGGRFATLRSTKESKFGPLTDTTPTEYWRLLPAQTSLNAGGTTATRNSGGPQLAVVMATSSTNMPVGSPNPPWWTPKVMAIVFPLKSARLNSRRR